MLSMALLAMPNRILNVSLFFTRHCPAEKVPLLEISGGIDKLWLSQHITIIEILQAMPPAETYRDLLMHRGYGYPLWEPNPREAPPVELADGTSQGLSFAHTLVKH